MIAWNPDAVAPPYGDVYAREREAGAWIKTAGRLCFVACLLAFAVALMNIGAHP